MMVEAKLSAWHRGDGSGQSDARPCWNTLAAQAASAALYIT